MRNKEELVLWAFCPHVMTSDVFSLRPFSRFEKTMSFTKINFFIEKFSFSYTIEADSISSSKMFRSLKNYSKPKHVLRGSFTYLDMKIDVLYLYESIPVHWFPSWHHICKDLLYVSKIFEKAEKLLTPKETDADCFQTSLKNLSQSYLESNRS